MFGVKNIISCIDNKSSKMATEECKMVIVVRNDLKLSKGKAAAQAGHAAVSCAFASNKKDPKTFREWWDKGQAKIVLKVDSEAQLYEIKSFADAQGIINCVITDAGRTEIAPGTVTCIGLGPAKVSDMNRLTGELKML